MTLFNASVESSGCFKHVNLIKASANVNVSGQQDVDDLEPTSV